MGFTVHDYHDLVKLLKMHPDWQNELRQLLLTDELLALPEIVQQLVLAQQHTEERLLRLEAIVQRLVEQMAVLAEGQVRIFKQLSSLEGRVGSLEEGQKRLEEGQKELKADVSGLKDDVSGLKDDVSKLKDDVSKLKDSVGELKGIGFERDYKDKVSAHFGRRLRRAKPTELYTLEDRLDEVLTLDELDDFFQLDLLVTGKLRHVPELPEVLLAMEISSVVDKNDVSRAVHRANLIRKAGYRSIPVVAGQDVTQGASNAVREQNVVLLQNGHMEFWEEAMVNWVEQKAKGVSGSTFRELEVL